MRFVEVEDDGSSSSSSSDTDTSPTITTTTTTTTAATGTTAATTTTARTGQQHAKRKATATATTKTGQRQWGRHAKRKGSGATATTATSSSPSQPPVTTTTTTCGRTVTSTPPAATTSPAAAAAAANGGDTQQHQQHYYFREQLQGIAREELLDAITVAFPQFGDRMTQIQHMTIPAVLRDGHSMAHDVMSRASTGSGKTIAFLVPCVDFLLRRLLHQKSGRDSGGKGNGISGNGRTQTARTPGAMILCPTRELALQTAQVATQLLDGIAKVDSGLGLRSVVTIGGNNKQREARELSQGCDLLIATPGRVLDHLNDGSLSIGTSRSDRWSFRYLVLDEADQLLDVGFEHDLRRIVSHLPALRSTMLFSATLSSKVQSLARVSLRMDRLINVGVDDDDNDNNNGASNTQLLKRNVSTLVQKFVIVPAEARLAALIAILNANQHSKIVLFVSIKAAVRFLGMALDKIGIKNIKTLHGSMSQQKRTNIFFEFMNKRTPGVLVATDVAARGLDFPDVDLVIQCDLPEDWEQHFHRAGRTARAGRAGVALLMLTPRERDSCLGVLQDRLKENAEDGTQRITEMPLPVSRDELQVYQDRLTAAVSGDAELSKFASGIPAQYRKVSQMHGKRIGLSHAHFDENAVRSSFGLSGSAASRGQSRSQRSRRR